MFGTNKKTILLVLFVWTLLNWGYLNKVNVRAEQVGNHTGSIIRDGLKRTYLIHIPPSFKKTKQMPLVIALHERIIGKTNRDIDANEVIWNFFKKHGRN